MATARVGDAGLILTDAFLDRYIGVRVTGQSPTELTADVIRTNTTGFTARLRGSFPNGPAGGTVNEISESLGSTFRFELTGVSIPYNTLVTQPGLLPQVLAGNDLVLGGAGNDTLSAYTGNNVIAGGAGSDTAVVNAVRSATLSFRWRDEAVVFRTTARQSDQLSSVEFVQFNDREYGTFEFPEVRPLEYLASYSDLAQVYGTNESAAWSHFARAGLAEGRSITFSGLNYIASYRDLAATYGASADAGARHFLSSGRAEGRTVSFDGLRYIASYRDLIQVLPHTLEAGAMHFISSGANEGRTVTFDPLRYIASNLDVARAFGADEARGLDQWINTGYTENRSTTAFDPAQYLALYADLRAAFGTDLRAATLHWINTGIAEGRFA